MEEGQFQKDAEEETEQKVQPEVQQQKEQSPKPKPPKFKLPNLWAIGTAIFFVLFLAAVFTSGFSSFGQLTPNEAAEQAVNFINNQLLPEGSHATLVEVKPISGVYDIKIDINGREYDSYITKDGNLLFPSGVPITAAAAAKPPEPKAFDAPDSQRPKVELYVMSFCPFGQQAEMAIAPAIDLLKDYIDFDLRFIVNIDGDQVSSLHGTSEANEDMRQKCILKYFPDKWWDYAKYVHENIPLNNIDEKWTEAASAAGIDVDKIQTCFEEEGLDLIQEDYKITSEKDITASPTLLINGERYHGARTSEAFKQAICSAFVEPPEICKQTLENSSPTPTGAC